MFCLPFKNLTVLTGLARVNGKRPWSGLSLETFGFFTSEMPFYPQRTRIPHKMLYTTKHK
jgi:hypothetical protein